MFQNDLVFLPILIKLWLEAEEQEQSNQFFGSKDLIYAPNYSLSEIPSLEPSEEILSHRQYIHLFFCPWKRLYSSKNTGE